MLYEVDNQKNNDKFWKGKKSMKKKNELLIETKRWWEAGQEEHEK
jgi:hypothetical protein